MHCLEVEVLADAASASAATDQSNFNHAYAVEVGAATAGGVAVAACYGDGLFMYRDVENWHALKHQRERPVCMALGILEKTRNLSGKKKTGRQAAPEASRQPLRSPPRALSEPESRRRPPPREPLELERLPLPPAHARLEPEQRHRPSAQAPESVAQPSSELSYSDSYYSSEEEVQGGGQPALEAPAKHGSGAVVINRSPTRCPVITPAAGVQAPGVAASQAASLVSASLASLSPSPAQVASASSANTLAGARSAEVVDPIAVLQEMRAFASLFIAGPRQ